MYIGFVPDAGIGIAEVEKLNLNFSREPFNKIALVQHKLPICQIFECSEKG
jgi:hypothetical protein